jgi:large subunit ribosomal protein L6
MSRVGKEAIAIPKDVKITVNDNRCIVEHAKNKSELILPAGIAVKVEEGLVKVSRLNEEQQTRCLHGTIRALINNMVIGVEKGFKKELNIIGVGYKAQMKDKVLVLNVGFSHTVEMPVPEGLKVSTPTQTKILVEGINKQEVGEFAACVRRVNPPEPYKGKGIRYFGEEVRKKLGKALAK